MTWQRECDSDGLPVWSGFDRVFDPYKHRRQGSFIGAGCGIVAGAGFGAFLLYGLAAATLEMVTGLSQTKWGRWEPFGVEIVWKDVLGIAFILLGIVAGAWALWWAVRRYQMPDGWFQRAWTLAASAGGLSFHAGPFSPSLDAAQMAEAHWWVSLDEISRVESGLTREWQRLRHYEGGPIFANDRSTGLIFSTGLLEVPGAEFQTFVFLTDGSRRVIHTVNADREGAGMLAQSIREWIEKARAKAKEVAPTPQMPGAMADERREGFDL